jgi:Domain of unknown function (DUF4399)
MRTFPPALLVLALLMIGGNPAHAQTATTGGPTPSPPGAKVYFVDLRDGAVIGPKTTIHFGLHGMGVAPAGSEKANSGHHHLLIDADLPPLDQPIPSDESHLHFGAGQTETDLELTPGPHTLQLLLGDKNHIPHSPPVMSERVHVTVAETPPPPAPAPMVQSSPASSGRHPSPPGAKVFFASPPDGSSEAATFQVRFGLDNMEVVRAGVDKPNSGHHHLLIDSPLPNLDEPIPNDENHLHFGAGQTEATITLTPGRHTLQLLLGDANHVPHDPPVFSAPITVVVGQDAQPKSCRSNETMNSRGACVSREREIVPQRNRQHKEVVPRPTRREAPRRSPPHSTNGEEMIPRERATPAANPEATFDDHRHCPPGSHSQTAPNGSGYRCLPD